LSFADFGNLFEGRSLCTDLALDTPEQRLYEQVITLTSLP